MESVYGIARARAQIGAIKTLNGRYIMQQRRRSIDHAPAGNIIGASVGCLEIAHDGILPGILPVARVTAVCSRPPAGVIIARMLQTERMPDLVHDCQTAILADIVAAGAHPRPVKPHITARRRVTPVPRIIAMRITCPGGEIPEQNAGIVSVLAAPAPHVRERDVGHIRPKSEGPLGRSDLSGGKPLKARIVRARTCIAWRSRAIRICYRGASSYRGSPRMIPARDLPPCPCHGQ